MSQHESHFNHFALAELYPFATQFPLQNIIGKKEYESSIAILFKNIVLNVD